VTPLAEPFQLTDAIRLRNRFVATAHASGAVSDGMPTAGDAEYWQRLAQGGAAMAIVGGSVVSLDSFNRRGNLTASWRPDVRPALRRRAAAIHRGGAVGVFQLIHLGRETLGAPTYYSPVSPSTVRSRREPTAPREMGEAELESILDAFVTSAANALAAGFDGVELHAAHGYLLGTLLSPVTNPDAETVAERAAPLWRIVDAIREQEPEALIGVRLSVGDADDAGLAEEQLAELLSQLHPEIQYVNLTVGMRGSYVRDMSTAAPPLLEPLPRLRALTERPLLISQAFRDQPEMEAALSRGANLVGMARGLIADPELPNKILSGNRRAVRPCTACNEDCRMFEPVLLCSVNPDLAPPGERERPARPLIVGPGLPGAAGRVAVVGAGPAGLECATTLARGNHREVVVWERSDAIGGGLALAGAAPHRDGWLRMIEFYRAALENENLELRLGAEPDAAALESFDAIVIASGAEEVLPDGAAAGFARTASAAIAAGADGLAGVSHLVVVDDGFGWWPAVNAVELGIAAGAAQITVVSPGTAFATAIPGESRIQLAPRLRGSRMMMRPLTGLVAAGEGSVELRHTATGDTERIAADAVVVVCERKPRDWEALLPEGANALVIGDAIVPRHFSHAIAEGRAAARAIARAQADTQVAWAR
jgi:2,4-dienoyl-CoA reductase-like NADH-dependent reductase (Old Yellow Enzyme family)